MRLCILVTALCCGSVLSAVPALADDAAAPDFSGIWGRNAFDYEPMAGGPGPVVNIQRLPNGLGDPNQLVGDHSNPILKPEAQAIVKQRGDISRKGEDYPDPSNHCSPYSPPFTFAMQLGLQMLQTKDQITILYNQDDQVRHIRMNGTHPANVTPSAMGDSIGHYEGDTLVVDTVGVKLLKTTMADRYGTPQSEAMHVIERYRLVDAEAAKTAQEAHEKKEGRVGGPAGAMPVDPAHGKGLQLQFTLDDSKVFTAPLSAQVHYRRARLPWQEQVCAENFFEYYNNRNTDIPSARTPDF